MDAGTHRCARTLAIVATICLCVARMIGAPASAHAVNVQTGPTTTASPNVEYVISTWTWARYRTLGNESVLGFTVTLPAGTDASGATSVGRPGTVTVSGTTVTVAFTTPIPRNTSFSVSIGGILNPPAGTYPAGTITFRVGDRNGNNPTSQTLPTGPVTITPGQGFLSLTITTPNDGQSIQFGAIDPGESASAQVQIRIESSAPYEITRTLDGAAPLLNLTAVGVPEGPQPPGIAAFADTVSIIPPWTTDPGAVTSTLVYTVVQQ